MPRALAARLLTGAGRLRPDGPRAIAYGSCFLRALPDHRRPADRGEARTAGGRVLVFDDVGCLAAWFRAATGHAAGW